MSDSPQPETTSSYPANTLVLLLIHTAYYYTRGRHARRRRQTLTHSTLWHRRKFYRAWQSLVSLHPPRLDTAATSPSSSSSLWTIPMGNSATTATPATQASSPILQNPLVQRVIGWYGALGGPSLWLLFYVTHLLWATRAVEGHYHSMGTMWIWLGSASVSLAFEGIVGEHLLGMVARHSEEGEDNVTLGSLKRLVRDRDLGGSAVFWASCQLSLFHSHFGYVGMPILPGLYSKSAWSYFVSLGLLYYSAVLATGRAFPAGSAVLQGAILGHFFFWDFVSEPYWGCCMLFWLVLLTLLSLKVRRPSWLCWIDYVGWNDRGRPIRFDAELRQWVAIDPILGNEMDSNADDDDSDSERAFPTSDDENIYGGSEALIPEASENPHVRSRHSHHHD